MNIKRMTIPVVVVLLSAAIAVGCANDAGKNTNEDTSTNQNSGTGTSAGEDIDQPVESGTSQETSDTDAMNKFTDLLNEKASSAELLSYITDNYTKVIPENLTLMLIELEKAQHEQSLALEDRYYEEEGMQEKLMDLYTDEFSLPSSEDVQDETLKKLLQDSEAAGYKPETMEGMFFPVIDYERYRLFQSNVTADMSAYIDIMALESNVPAVKDAGIVIGWSEVVDRALAMEKFLQTYSESVKSEDVQNLLDGYTFISFQGIDNAPLFSYEDDTFLTEVKTAFTTAVSNGTDNSQYLQTMKEFLELIEKNGDKQTDEVIAYQDKVTAGLLE